jgi:PAS domain S-box-containing protein
MVEAVFRLAMEAMLLADDEGRYIRVNPAASELTGYSFDELLAMTVFDLTPLQSREDGLATWREFLRNGKMSGEYSLVRKDGSIVVVEFCAVAGIRPGVHLSILHDVTARVRLERRVRLAASFQEATAALNAAVDVEQVAAVVLSTGLTSLGARAGHLVMIGDDGWAEVVA